MATYRNVEIPDILTRDTLEAMMARVELRIDSRWNDSFLCNYYDGRHPDRKTFQNFLKKLGIDIIGWGFDEIEGVMHRQWIIDLGPTPNRRRLQLLKEIYEQL